MSTDAATTAQVRFGRLSRPVAFVDCRHLIDDFPHFFRNWHIAEVPSGRETEPIITVARATDGYRLTASWFNGPLERRDDIDAVCALIAELIRASVDDDTDFLCLHAAAAHIAGRLVVFPNRYRAGKSLLSGCLAARGIRIFADDVLPLVGPDAMAMAPGIAPRLRLPLPDNLDRKSRDFLIGHRGPSNDCYAYLDLPASQLADFGERAPIDGFVLLDRRDDGPARLEPITRSRALRQAIWQNFGRKAGPEIILARLERAVRQATCYQLTYCRADDAASLLEEAFAKQPAPRVVEPISTEPRPADIAPGAATNGSARYRRRPGLAGNRLDGETYLADSDTGAIHHLDAIATAVWHLLGDPMSEDQIAAELRHAFPDVAAHRIAADVKALLGDLKTRKLILSS